MQSTPKNWEKHFVVVAVIVVVSEDTIFCVWLHLSSHLGSYIVIIRTFTAYFMSYCIHKLSFVTFVSNAIYILLKPKVSLPIKGVSYATETQFSFRTICKLHQCVLLPYIAFRVVVALTCIQSVTWNFTFGMVIHVTQMTAQFPSEVQVMQYLIYL